METWRSIPEFDGYEVSDNGNVRSFFRKGGGNKMFSTPLLKKIRILYPDGKQNPTCYRTVALRRNKHTFHISVGRLVLMAFVGPCPMGCEMCHNNGNSLDDRPENLRWDTRANNILDKSKHGTSRTPRKIKLGKQYPIALLQKAIALRQDGHSLSDVKRITGITKTHISRLARGMVSQEKLNWKRINKEHIKRIDAQQRKLLRKDIYTWAIEEYKKDRSFGSMTKVAKRAHIKMAFLSDLLHGRRVPKYMQDTETS